MSLAWWLVDWFSCQFTNVKRGFAMLMERNLYHASRCHMLARCTIHARPTKALCKYSSNCTSRAMCSTSVSPFSHTTYSTPLPPLPLSSQPLQPRHPPRCLRPLPCKPRLHALHLRRAPDPILGSPVAPASPSLTPSPLPTSLLPLPSWREAPVPPAGRSRRREALLSRLQRRVL